MEKDFHEVLLLKMGAIEGKQDMLIKSIDELKEDFKTDNSLIRETTKTAIEALQSAKSAHHRIDSYKISIAKMIGAIGTVITIIYTIISNWFTFKT